MSPYPLLTERDGDNIIWRPKSGELVEGVGRLQAFFEVGTDVIGSSDMISCEVDSSLLGADPGTDPGQTDLPWALDIIEQIAELSGHYPKIENGVLYVWDSEQEDWVQFQGGGSATVIVTVDDTTDPMTASMTAAEIKAAVDSGSVVKMLNGNLFLDCVAANEYLSTFAIAVESSVHTCLVTASGTVPTVQSVDIPSKTSDLINDSGFIEAVTVTVDDTVDPLVASMNAVQIKNAVDSGKNVELDFRGSKLQYAYATEFVAAFGLASNDSIITCLVTTSGRAEFTTAQIPSLTGYVTETWVEGKGYQTAAQVQTAIAGKADKTQRITMTAQDTTPTLDPNKFYVFPEMASLAITLATPADSTVVSEYHFIFTSGAAPTVLTVPASVRQPDGFTVEANMHYEISILEGAMTAQGWAVTA